MSDTRIYFHNGGPVYAREDRGPFRVVLLEQGERVRDALWRENQPRQASDRLWHVTQVLRREATTELWRCWNNAPLGKTHDADWTPYLKRPVWCHLLNGHGGCGPVVVLPAASSVGDTDDQ